MNRQTRKQLKTDKFAEDLGQTFSFLNEHRTEAVRYGLIGLAVVILGAGYYFYSRHEASVREDAMAAAMKINDAIIAPSPTPTNLNFATQEEKDKATTQAFADLASKFHGTPEGAVGGIFVAAAQADKGNLPAAEKLYKDVMDSAPSEYSAQARVSLAHVYAGEGKTQEAEKLLRYLMDHPTALISKEEATLELADVLSKSNCTEALKLIQPLTTPLPAPGGASRTAVSKAALSEVGKISGSCKT